MYSILVVDDERFMRQGIAKLLPWRELNIDFVETADSGASALERMEAHMPDIVLTDIEMSNMDGLSLIRRMNQLNPQLRIIVLTGHHDFNYVQECCRMEVHDYLLKPVEVDKLAAAIAAQVAELDRLAAQKKQDRMRSRASGLAEQRRVVRAFHTFLRKRTGEREVRRLLADYGWQEPEGFQVALIAPDRKNSAPSGQEDLRYEMQELSASGVSMELVENQRHGISLRDKKNALVLILFRGPDHPAGEVLAEQVQAVLQNEYDIPQKIYLGKPVEQVSQVPDSYRDAVAQRERHRQTRRTESEEERLERMIQCEASLQQQIIQRMGTPDQAMKRFEDFCLKLEASQFSLEWVRQSCYRVLSGVYYSWTAQHGTASGPSLIEVMGRIQSATEDSVYELCRTFLKQLLYSGQSRTEDVIASAKEYIAGHLEEDLSVSQLAAKYYLSPAYFSRLFKKTEGVGCNYYIICQRMERAYQYLRGSNLRVNQVAEQVGYRDVNYFSLAFKKYTGVTPAEYREQAKRGGTAP